MKTITYTEKLKQGVDVLLHASDDKRSTFLQTVQEGVKISFPVTKEDALNLLKLIDTMTHEATTDYKKLQAKIEEVSKKKRLFK
jgi:hypothetical protein